METSNWARRIFVPAYPLNCCPEMLVKHTRQRVHILRQVVELAHTLAAGNPKPSPQRRIFDKPLDSRGQRISRGCMNQEPIETIANQLRNSCNAGTHAGNFHGHCFHQCNRNALSEARQSEDISLANQLPGLFVIPGSLEDHGDTLLRRESFQAFTVRASAYQTHPKRITLSEQ